MPEHETAPPLLDDSVEYALQCVLCARQDLAALSAGDTTALASLTVALEEASARLYEARRRATLT